MAIAVGVFVWLASESRRDAGEGRTANAPPARAWRIPAEKLERLAGFEQPAYQPGAGESPEFQRAMQRYSQRDYAGAISDLRAVNEAQPESAGPRFYLAICQLLTKDRAPGVTELRTVIAAGDTPYLERARFYLAKGLLAGGDVRGAYVQLRIVAEMHGNLEQPARTLLAQIGPSS